MQRLRNIYRRMDTMKKIIFILLSLFSLFSLSSCKKESIHFIEFPQFEGLNREDIVSIEIGWESYNDNTIPDYKISNTNFYVVKNDEIFNQILDELFDEENEYIKSESEVYTKGHIIIKTKDSTFFEFIPAYQKYGNTKTYYTCVNYDLLKIMYDYGKDNNYI